MEHPHGPGHPQHPGSGTDSISNMPHQHAFVVVGVETIFLHHMTNMWMEEHSYQVIYRVRLPGHVKAAYLADRRAHPTHWHMIGNVQEDKMLLANIKIGARKSFVASMWRGWPTVEGEPDWPWANQPPLVENFRVTVESVVYHRHFDFGLEHPPKATYILFGAGNEGHLSHYQVKQLDYDHVMTLTHPPAWLPPQSLQAGVHVTFSDLPVLPDGAIPCSAPITDSTHMVMYSGAGPLRPLSIDRTLFFTTFPVNSQANNPCPFPNPPPSAHGSGGNDQH